MLRAVIILTNRPIGQREVTMKECKRCGQMRRVSAVGEVLFHFVCDICRLDANTFNLGHDSTIKDMTRQLVAENDNA